VGIDRGIVRGDPQAAGADGHARKARLCAPTLVEIEEIHLSGSVTQAGALCLSAAGMLKRCTGDVRV
jgi:hypothetical protein